MYALYIFDITTVLITSWSFIFLDPIHEYVLVDHETVYPRETAPEDVRQISSPSGNHQLGGHIPGLMVE